MNGISMTQTRLLSRTLKAILLAALGWQLAWWTWHFITPSLKKNSFTASAIAAPDIILGRQLFGDAGPSTAAVSAAPQTVHLGGETLRFAAGEALRTEYCHKYSVAGFGALARRAGWRSVDVWTDPDCLFSVHDLAGD